MSVSTIVLMLVSLVACAMTPAQSSPGHSMRGVSPAALSQNMDASVHKEWESAARWRSCAELVYPDGSHSASDLQALFERPENIEQMLQNLKLAADQDWLLQPHFYDAGTLLKFFNGSTVTWKERKPDPLSKQVEVIVVDVGSHIFPDITVRVEAHCRLTTYEHRDSRPEQKVTIGGNLHIYGRPIPEMSLRVIRHVLGQELENTIETGVTYHGPDYTPQIEGRVIYSNRAKQQLAGTAIGTTFYFALRPPPKPKEAQPRELIDDDVVQAIVLTEEQHRILEN